jgi:hypothetical protein
MTIQANPIFQRESALVVETVRAAPLRALVVFTFTGNGVVHSCGLAIVAQHASAEVAKVVAAHFVTAATLAADTARRPIQTVGAKVAFANVAGVAFTANRAVALLALQQAVFTVARAALGTLVTLPNKERVPTDVRVLEQAFMVLAPCAMAHPQFRGQTPHGRVESVLHGAVQLEVATLWTEYLLGTQSNGKSELWREK